MARRGTSSRPSGEGNEVSKERCGDATSPPLSFSLAPRFLQLSTSLGSVTSCQAPRAVGAERAEGPSCLQ